VGCNLSTSNIRNADTQRRDEKKKKACNNDETCQVGKVAEIADITFGKRPLPCTRVVKYESDYRLSERRKRADHFVIVSSLVQSKHQQKEGVEKGGGGEMKYG